MKASLIALALILAVVLISPASASAVTNAGVKPGSFWYGFDLAFEKINLFFTFNSEGKAKKALEYADERLAEAQAVAENNNTNAVKTAITNYESNIAFAAEKSKDVSEKEKAEALLTSIADNTAKHQEILADVLAKVPNEAKEAITKAIKVSRKGQEEAMRQVAELRGEVEQLKKKVAELKQSDDGNQAAEIAKLKQEIEELKKKPAPAPVPIVSAPKPTPLPPTSNNNSLSPTPPPVENWLDLESKYFTEANQKGWVNLIITNSLGEKRYYRKEGSLWVQKNSEAEIQQPYVAPPTLSQLTRLIRMCSSDPEVQAICDKPAFMPGYYSNLAFRTAIDSQVLRWETIVANQRGQVISTTILPPLQLPSYVFSTPPPVYTPPPTYNINIPPTTYSPPSTGRIEFLRDPRTNRIYSSSNGANYFYDLNGRLDHVIGPNSTAQINYDLNGNIDSINY